MQTIFEAMKNAVFVFIGGGLGSVLRYLISILIPATSFPYATFIVNIIGSFLIGCFVAYNAQTTIGHNNTMFLFLTTGICGGFTTFSTFSKESYMMLQQQQWGFFVSYIVLSIILCLGATALGFYVVKTMN